MAFKLPPNQQLVAAGKWPVVGEKRPHAGANTEHWTVTIAGCVRAPRTWSLEELLALPRVECAIDIHCVTRWSKPAVRFAGVSLAEILEAAQPAPEARYVSFTARSERGHSTSLLLADALALGALVAFTADGAPLAEEHGGPVRVVVPGRYFYKSLKWLERIELLESDRLGFWEAGAGYHNVADPWREERYAAPALDRRTVREVLARRDFRGRDLRSLAADDRELEGLDARGALLRDASFRRARLCGARFDGANLSNAHLEGADLRGASFAGADVEGADYRGADLRGADFRGAALTAASFTPQPGSEGEWGDAVIDGTTAIDAAGIEVLTPVQAEFVRRALAGGCERG
jgi:DMSO/TMAO reductase YedYZ molybdopterin-dependent catalytic subunit